MSNENPFIGNLLRWPVDRPSRTFKVFVVEPFQYEPDTHSSVFLAALNALLNPTIARLDANMQEAAPHSEIERFDLITFPEAFLPSNGLLSLLNTLTGREQIGCIHVGLRPALDDRHLFGWQELCELVKSLRKIDTIIQDDLDVFSEWLRIQPQDHKFNVACFFTVDTNRKLRVCLHPKLIRSRFEYSAKYDHQMAEANLLTLVTLIPKNKNLLSATIQPIICSDALDIEAPTYGKRPLIATNDHADSFGEMPPDHIDIVSVANCTPQQKLRSNSGHEQFRWHQDFCDAFIGAGKLTRHRFTAFVLANFHRIPEKEAPPSGVTPAGLSGIFMPSSLHAADFQDFVSISWWGRRAEHQANEWLTMEDLTSGDQDAEMFRRSRAFTASLAPLVHSGDAVAHMLGFELNCLTRDASRTSPMPPFSRAEMRSASKENDKIVFGGKITG